MVEGKKGKKMYLGGIKMFSDQVVKKLYCHARESADCQYYWCSELGFPQLNHVAGVETMIPFISLCVVNSLSRRHIGSKPEANGTGTVS